MDAKELAEVINEFIARGSRAYVRRDWKEIVRVEVGRKNVKLFYADGGVVRLAPDVFMQMRIVVDLYASSLRYSWRSSH